MQMVDSPPAACVPRWVALGGIVPSIVLGAWAWAKRSPSSVDI